MRVKINRGNSVLREMGRADHNLKLLTELEKEFGNQRCWDTKSYKDGSPSKHTQEKWSLKTANSENLGPMCQ